MGATKEIARQLRGRLQAFPKNCKADGAQVEFEPPVEPRISLACSPFGEPQPKGGGGDHRQSQGSDTRVEVGH
eukprot:6891122-Lingulodinium_polyedra.AAC.1